MPSTKRLTYTDLRPLGVDIPRDGRHEANHVDRAAGTGEPRRPARGTLVERAAAVEGERIRIEEPIAAQRDARQEAVVDHAFQHIDVLGVAVQQEHALVPEGIGDRGACFQVSRLVGQCRSLSPNASPCRRRTDAPGQVQLLRNDVVPNTVDRLAVGRFAGQSGHVGDTRVEVTGPHGMSHRLVLVDYGDVVLAIGTVGLPLVGSAAHGNEELRQFQVVLVTGRPVELDQADFDLFVTGYVDLLASGRRPGRRDRHS